MKRFGNPLLSFSAPFLILIACSSLVFGNGNNKLQTLPAFAVGTGLIISGALVRRYRRKQLLFALENRNDHED
tara:strand:+ start:102 stop:320 length:219 start_codon:yes stop_codon:yes gene_type:complete